MSAAFELPSQFETFNARSLRPDEVARTFVPPEHFWTIAKPSHTMIVGPRGSGKTTLLKMLQQPALEAWHGEDAGRARRQIGYTSVFIPTDRSWQIRFGGVGPANSDAFPRLGQAAFSTHVLRALVGAFRHRSGRTVDLMIHRFPHRRAQLSGKAERELSSTLAGAWRLPVSVPTLAGVHLALTERLMEIRMLALQVEDRTRHQLPATELPEFVYLTFVEAAVLGVEAFETAANVGSGKWAMLFDELELAPAAIRTELISAPRSVDDRFIFKLSLSPFSKELGALERPDAPAPGHDFVSVQLSYPRKEDGYGFCRALLSQMLRARNLSDVPAEEVFGRSVFSTDPVAYRKGKSAYGPDSAITRDYKELSRRDESFRVYLDERGIDLNNLHEGSHSQRAAEVRKLRALVAVRNAFRRADTDEHKPQRLRSRKAPALYAGADALFAAVEGNPRLFIGIIGGIFDAATGAGWRYPISRPIQSREVERASHRFLALLRTIPVISDEGAFQQGRPKGVLDVIRNIGEAFRKEIVSGPFDPEPFGSFTVDSHSAETTVDLLGLALNSGGIVYVPDPDGAEVLSSLRGKRFRLSYLVAAAYGLPPRLDKAVSLSRLLSTLEHSGASGDVDVQRLPGIN